MDTLFWQNRQVEAMIRKESSPLGPSSLDFQMKAGTAFREHSEALDRPNGAQEMEVWRSLFQATVEAIDHATTMEELFHVAAQDLQRVAPCDGASLVLRTSDAKFVRALFVVQQGQIIPPGRTAWMPYRRFARLMNLPAGQSHGEELSAKLWPLFFPEKYPSILLVALKGLPLFSPEAGEGDLSATPPEKEMLSGGLAMVSHQVNAFTPPHRDLLVALADLLAAGIYKVQLLQERRRMLKNLHRLAESGWEMGTAMDLDTALRKIAQAAVRTLPIPCAGIAICEPIQCDDSLWPTASNPYSIEMGAVIAGELGISKQPANGDEATKRQAIERQEQDAVAAHHSATDTSFLKAPDNGLLAGWPLCPLRLTAGLVKRLLRNRPVVVADIPKSRLFADDAKVIAARHDIHSYLGMPILLHHRLGQGTDDSHASLALLSIYAHEPHDFDRVEMTVLQALAAQSAQVLENVRLYQQDILQRRAAESEIRRRSQELENFVYVISHNLKTPIVSIQGFANLLLEELGPILDHEHLHFLERIRKNAALMDKMIHDLLEFSRLGRSPAKFEMVNAKDIVQSVIDEMHYLDQAHDVEFLLPVEPAGLPCLYADASGLRTVFENLLNNAVKYRRPGAPLRIEAGWEEQSRFHVFWVRDNGMGMDPAFHAKAFDLFQRGPNVRQIQGTGVGLAIVRRIVENHKGLVRLDSKPGEGTTIYFTIPKKILPE